MYEKISQCFATFLDLIEVQVSMEREGAGDDILELRFEGVDRAR